MYRCDTCKYYYKVETAELGECHRHPPSIQVLSEDGYGVFPKVNTSDFCGDYKEDLPWSS